MSGFWEIYFNFHSQCLDSRLIYLDLLLDTLLQGTINQCFPQLQHTHPIFTHQMTFMRCVLVPEAPKGLTLHSENKTIYKILWLPVLSTNGQILTYEIRKISTKGPHEKQEEFNVSCSEVPCGNSSLHICAYIFQDIEKCSRYKISIRAYTRRGPGPYSKILPIQQKGNSIIRRIHTMFVDLWRY